jgi:D-aspartate ligase
VRNDLDQKLANLPDSPVPGVLLGSLHLVRVFGLAGIPTVVASCDAREIAFASRHCNVAVHLPPLSEPDRALRLLERIGARLAERFGRRIPLAFGNDDFLRLIYANRARLERHFAMLLNDPEIGEALLDKDRFALFASERGLPVPKTYAWDAEGANALISADHPVVAKPAVKFEWSSSPMLATLFGGAKKALIFENGRVARADGGLARHHEQLVFQEYIPGDDANLWCFDGIADARGTLLTGYSGRKLRTFPPLTGESSYIELLHDEALHDVARDVVARVPLKGIFNLDFKKDPRSGRFRLLEVNARHNFWLYLAARNGVNLAADFHEYVLRGTLPLKRTPRQMWRWIDFALDRRACRALVHDRELSYWRWALSLARPTVYSVFAWSDPMPLASVWMYRARAKLARGSGRLRQRFFKAM